MMKIPFDEKEMNVKETAPNFFGPPGSPGLPIYSYPVTPRECFEAMYRKEAQWMPSAFESAVFTPQIIPDNIARGFIIEKNMMPIEQYGGKDMFGVEWEYVPMVGGSMEKPGVPHLFTDANEWKEKIVWPDIDSWDWEGCARENKEFLDNGKANMFWFLNGATFERLVSFMGFENAAIALIDEEQQDALHELFQKLADLHIAMIDKACEAFGDGISGFTVHDDWGSQRAPFFSFQTAEEMLVPYMRQITDHIKSKGKIADLHSCGHIESQIENIIAAGWQSWTPMAMNNTLKLYEEYGDQIIIGVCDTPFDKNASAEEQKARGEAFARKYFSTNKPSTYSLYSAACMTPPYMEGIYRASRA
ncbi:MAG: uroporphyrinogen decarboxylase family protein [Eubacteriales bacterium]|nr:uroporphyrinogen decarboxylase family protein [Eubacteriales bacterium]